MEVLEDENKENMMNGYVVTASRSVAKKNGGNRMPLRDITNITLEVIFLISFSPSSFPSPPSPRIAPPMPAFLFVFLSVSNSNVQQSSVEPRVTNTSNTRVHKKFGTASGNLNNAPVSVLSIR